MRVSREKAAESRERIIDAASALFRAKGFDGIGVADIMKAANLTHGGFYGHFASKDDLVAQASRRSMARAAANWERVVAAAPDKPYAALLDHYLSPRHRDDPGKGCAFAALSNDAARCGKACARRSPRVWRLCSRLSPMLCPGSRKPRDAARRSRPWRLWSAP